MAITQPSISFSGVSSGLDTKSIVSALMDIERAGLTKLQGKKSTLLARQQAYRDLDTKLKDVRTRAKALSDLDKVLDFKATSTDEKKITSTAASNATAGTYKITINQQATQSVLNGTSDIGKKIDKTAALNSVNSLGSSFVGGTFMINGEQFTVAATDTLQDILATIEASANISVATYDDPTDKVKIEAQSGSLVLGSAGDTSNFLDLLNLKMTAADKAESGAALGRLDRSAVMNNGSNGLRSNTAITQGAGSFKINGVSIAYDTNTDSLNNVLQRITESSAGVTATYDSILDRVVLTNKAPGSDGIFTQDVSGNLVAALGINVAATQGQNASISIEGINGGNPITSQDNLFTEAETGITGVSFTVQAASGSADVTVATDTSAVVKKFQDFVADYNALVNYITQSTKAGSSDGKTKAGVLYGEQDVRGIAQTLRTTLASQVSGITSGPSTLAGIGVSTTGQSATLAIDTAKLEKAILDNATNVKKIVADATNGTLAKVVTYVESQTNLGIGPLAEKPAKMEPSISRMNDSIEKFMRNLDVKERQLNRRFQAMERAIAQLNQGGVSSVLSNLAQTS